MKLKTDVAGGEPIRLDQLLYVEGNDFLFL
jgi:hypothetical protein